MKTKFQHYHFVYVLALFVTGIVSTYAQNDSSSIKLLNDYIDSKGYKDVIIFDDSNIKQFWTDNSVLGNNGNIVIHLDDKDNSNLKRESHLYKIQLANVYPMMDCRLDVITDNSDLAFSVMDNQSNVLSNSVFEEDFIQYHVLTASFHLIDAEGFSFNIKFFSNTWDIAIKKIVLSFSNNTSDFLESPGILKLEPDNTISYGVNPIKEESDNNQFVVRGKRVKVASQKKIIISDNILQNSCTVKNVGDRPTRVYLAYVPFTKDGKQINGNSTLYKDSNQILKVLSHEKGSNKVVVDTFPKEWARGCCLALKAKEDLSDFPNCNIIDGRIQEINKISNDHAEILLDTPATTAIEPGTYVRIQAPNRGTYMYPETRDLEPGEEITFSSSLKKDDSCCIYFSNIFCKGTYYVIPMIMSYSLDSKEENTILIKDFIVSY